MGQWAWPRIAAVYVMAVAPGLAAFAFSQRWYNAGAPGGGAQVLSAVSRLIEQVK